MKKDLEKEISKFKKAKTKELDKRTKVKTKIIIKKPIPVKYIKGLLGYIRADEQDDFMKTLLGYGVEYYRNHVYFNIMVCDMYLFGSIYFGDKLIKVSNLKDIDKIIRKEIARIKEEENE